LNGARLVLVEPGPHAPFELADAISDRGVTTAFFTTALFHQIVDHAPEALAPLRQLLIGGEVLSPARVARARAILDPRAALDAVYGPTENTTFTTYYPVRAGDLVEGPVALGRPVSNTAVAVVDAAGRLLPDGLAGQLVAGGDGVALGYVGRPDLTAERFVANDLDPRLGERLYRTGDWARWRADGQLEFLGRSDRQVKIRGFRVEPAELEAALGEHPDVADAFVTVAEYGPDDRRLVAYVVAAVGAVSDARLREHVAGRLPRAFQPAAIVRLGALPLRANGKVDPARLPPPPGRWFAQDLDDPSAPESTLDERPRGADALEATVLAVFQEVTGVRDVGPDDDFFDLGGHSLMAVELVAALERTTGGRLALRALFDAPTPAGISAVLRGEGVRPQAGSLVALTTTGTRPPFFAITAGDGNVVGFGPLARRLGPDQPFYALQPRGLDGEADPHTSVESMAREYVDLIRSVQPAGPYLLGGRCFGAVVGYEVARLLERAGETVAVLVSIDSGGPDWTTRRMANGRAYDVAMNAARVRSRASGVDHGDVFADRAAADAFVAWLAEPAAEHEGVVVSRYLYSAYLARADLREAYPLDDVGGAALGHAGLNAWAWTSGRSEFDLQEDLLGDPPPEIDPTSPSPARDAPAEPAGADPVSLVLRAAEGAARRYRAGPLRAPVVLIHATRGPHSLPWLEAGKWYGVEAGAVEDRVVEGTHHGILREPAVAQLADEVAATIDRALAGLPRDD
ncbi:MAG TPA: AMP-binding protein, partial [Acidimicrobiales bacterium]|nr:AMP-binding protein [Acidimicrobiales bacterium]